MVKMFTNIYMKNISSYCLKEVSMNLHFIHDSDVQVDLPLMHPIEGSQSSLEHAHVPPRYKRP